MDRILFDSFEINSKSALRNLKCAISLCAMLLALSFPAEAQQPKKVYRIGYLANSAAIGPREEAFRQGLRDLGYVEGQSIVIEWRFSKGKLDRLPDLAAELVRLKMDCIVAYGVNPTRAAKQATTTIPIVMGNADDDPVRHGLIASLARPGGNVTGITNLGTQLGGKRLELLKEAVPKAARVAVLYDPAVGPCTRGEGPPSCGTRTEVDCSVLGDTRCGLFRESIRWTKEGAPGWTLCARRDAANVY